MITQEQNKQIRKLSKRAGNKISIKFEFEAIKFLQSDDCKITKENKTGRRFEHGTFEMIYLIETELYYFISR